MTNLLEKHRNPGFGSSRAEIVFRLDSPEAHEKRRQTYAWYAERHRGDVRRLRERGLVLGAIAKTMGLSERTVVAVVNELEAEGWLERRPRYGRGFISRGTS
jgi:DNA-binding transcriptional MocR family regulator